MAGYSNFPFGDINTFDINTFEREDDRDKYVIEFRASLDVSRYADPPHCHPYIQIWYTKSGSYHHFFQNNDFLLTQGSILIVPPYHMHHIDTRGDSVLVRCEFTDNFILNTADEEFRDTLFNTIYLEPILASTNLIEPYHYFSKEATEKIESIFDELCHEFSKMDAFSSMFIRSNIVRLLALVAREYNLNRHDNQVEYYRDALDNAISYINTHYTENIYLDDVCKIAMMSRRSFSYLFKQLMSMSFSQYLQYLRVLKAQELLVSTDRTQHDIADACGFKSISYFHRVFKQFTGMLPGQYRTNPPKNE